MKHSIKTITALLLGALLLIPLSGVSAFAARSVFIGDISMDGAIGPEDARYALRMSIGLENYTAAHRRLADADSNGEVTPADARLILRTAVGIENLKRMVVLSDAELTTYVFTDASSTIGSGGSGTQTHSGSQNTPLPSATVPKPVAGTTPGTFTFISYGWGDGVGLSQYGAVGMAKNGYTCEQILNHYFTGVRIATDTVYPEYTNYLGSTVNTDELIARMLYMEMYGIVDDNPASAGEALKAQTIALFTLLKFYRFTVTGLYQVGVASSRSYSELPAYLKDIVRQVRGQYLTLASDISAAPIEALFFAVAAAKTASAKDVWGSEYSYLQSASSPYDISAEMFTRTFTIPREEMRQLIMAYDSSISLPSDPSQWITILSHSASIDAERGYVTKVRVGDKVLDGYRDFCNNMMENYFWNSRYFGGSTCFWVAYTP